MKNKYNKDYYENGVAKGISGYDNYRWIPELTYPMAHAFYNFLKLKRNSNILEYGCANGYLVKCLNDFGVNSYGVDISNYAINNCPTDVKNRLVVIKKNSLNGLYQKMFLSI